MAEYQCDKEARISVIENRVCRVEKDFKEHQEKLSQMDRTQDRQAEFIVRFEAKFDAINTKLTELIDDKKSNKTFWRDKGVSLISTLMGGIILAYLLIRFGLK